MIKKRSLITVFMVLVFVFLVELIFNTENIMEETLSRYGSSGSEVRNIQTKLKNWGYYKGSIDGIYGSRTVSAVKSFQRKNGLTADGIAGASTLAAMGISSGSTAGTNQANIELLARAIHGEARGEPYTGMVAVRSSYFK